MMSGIDKLAYFEKIGYQPHSAGQMSYHMSDARFRVPVCGRRYGKSTMAGRDLAPKLFAPKKRFWIVGPTYDLGEKEFRVIWDDLIVGQKLGRDKRVKRSYNKRSGEMYIEFPWQTRLEVRSADHPENLVGEALDGAILSEAAKHKKETFERFIRPALADKRGFADFPTTPEGFNWLYDQWRLGQNPDYPEYASWTFPSWDNRVVYPEGRNDPEILLLERTTVREWFLQEIGAEFASFVGKIFSEWNESRHVQRVLFDPNLPNYGTFDWGYTSPLAFIEFQITPMGQVRVWREHYLAYTTLETHIQMLRNREQPPGYHLDMTFGDAADQEAAEYVSQNWIACIAEQEAKKNWRQGIDLVKMHLKEVEVGKLDEYGTPKTEPLLVVDHSCGNLIREFNNYRAVEGSRGQNPREIAQKIDDHGLDALRYGMMHAIELGVKHHLGEVMEDEMLTTIPDDGGYFTSAVNF